MPFIPIILHQLLSCLLFFFAKQLGMLMQIDPGLLIEHFCKISLYLIFYIVFNIFCYLFYAFEGTPIIIWIFCELLIFLPTSFIRLLILSTQFLDFSRMPILDGAFISLFLYDYYMIFWEFMLLLFLILNMFF